MVLSKKPSHKLQWNFIGLPVYSFCKAVSGSQFLYTEPQKQSWAFIKECQSCSIILLFPILSWWQNRYSLLTITWLSCPSSAPRVLFWVPVIRGRLRGGGLRISLLWLWAWLDAVGLEISMSILETFRF